ncbi:ribosome modulation factor [Mycolicibacterium brisbanense]
MTKRAEYMFALYSGSLAELGDRNPYAGGSLVLAKLWMRGYMRMLSVRINSGPAMQTYLAARRSRQFAGTTAEPTSRRRTVSS